MECQLQIQVVCLLGVEFCFVLENSRFVALNTYYFDLFNVLV